MQCTHYRAVRQAERDERDGFTNANYHLQAPNIQSDPRGRPGAGMITSHVDNPKMMKAIIKRASIY